ncbi:MAG: type VI secretion system baseplate subunit TssG [Fibromonadaceae bacterium]|jgi:predicted component of type VI protein secretion system|nr:type VI secretion system baseplate subunit TssG [Fibromonadaceae bacterium]
MGIKNSFFEWVFTWFSNKNESRKLRIIASNSLKHPSGDLDFVKSKEGEVLLAVHEMSLLGADSPLPDSLLRGARADSENAAILTELLNAFQHHLAMLRFNALLEKSNFLMQELGDVKWKNRFALYNEKFSPYVLQCFFAKLFPDCKISVHCFEPLRIKNPAPAILGAATLNNTMLLGKNCTSITHAMRIDICGKHRSSYGKFPLHFPQIPQMPLLSNVKFPYKIKINFNDFKWEKWI